MYSGELDFLPNTSPFLAQTIVRPSLKVQLNVTGESFDAANNQYVIDETLTNVGNVSGDWTLTGSKLGLGATLTRLPIALGTIPPGATSGAIELRYDASAAVRGRRARLSEPLSVVTVFGTSLTTATTGITTP